MQARPGLTFGEKGYGARAYTSELPFLLLCNPLGVARRQFDQELLAGLLVHPLRIQLHVVALGSLDKASSDDRRQQSDEGGCAESHSECLE